MAMTAAEKNERHRRRKRGEVVPFAKAGPVVGAKETPQCFWQHVERRGPDDCWPFNGSTSDVNYGSVRWAGRTQRAHRIAYTLAYGQIPDGLNVLHSCDNPPCCNPAHLFLGTQAENSADMIRKNRVNRTARFIGAAHPRAKLTEEAVFEARWLRKAGMPWRRLAARFGVSKTTITAAVIGRTWKCAREK